MIDEPVCDELRYYRYVTERTMGAMPALAQAWHPKSLLINTPGKRVPSGRRCREWTYRGSAALPDLLLRHDANPAAPAASNMIEFGSGTCEAAPGVLS